MSDKINFQEFKLFGEIPLLLALRLKKIFGKKSRTAGGVLVIDTCIIGDFIATLPALRTYIEAQGEDIDLVVSPPLKSLAEGIRGVRKVFPAKSVYHRSNETEIGLETMPVSYMRVLVLRISPDSYKMLKNIRYSTIRLYDITYFKYYGHLLKNILLKRNIKQWSDVNFEMIGFKKPDRMIGYNDIFKFSDADALRVRDRPEMAGSRKKIIIHTGSGWSVKLWSTEKWVELLKKSVYWESITLS